jgi:hypothetical protein
LREEDAAFLRRLNDRLVENTDLAKLVANLEQGYQSGKGSGLGARVTPVTPEVPDAEEIAAELEDFLTRQNRTEDDN